MSGNANDGRMTREEWERQKRAQAAPKPERLSPDEWERKARAEAQEQQRKAAERKKKDEEGHRRWEAMEKQREERRQRGCCPFCGLKKKRQLHGSICPAGCPEEGAHASG